MAERAELDCNYAFADDDGDPDNSTIEWHSRFGLPRHGSESLTSGYLVGETVTCTVTANDGETTGNTTSAQLLIEPTCDGSNTAGELFACVTAEFSTKHPIHERLGGFNVNLSYHGMAIWDDRLIAKARATTAGHFRYPAGFGYAGSWRTGTMVEDWALRFEADKKLHIRLRMRRPQNL